MTNNGWGKIETIFHFALKLKAEEREAYLKTECADDVKLREDVESLLDSFENKADFLDKPVFELGLGAIGEAGQKNLAGQEIGVYRIEEKIGAGGMGEVYRAIDTRLNRQVALKFLPQSMENDRAARRRLVKEAQAAAALSHQNICAVHSVEESDEQIFIVMQYIEGETLDKSLNGSEISAEEFKFLARQIVTAVAFAHSHGVIHRDLKPGNIMLTEDGEIKILDFGLAKVNRETAFLGGEVDQQSNLSSSGLIIGTVAYMSPEQLRGKKADYRSDIFSLGIIFYELLAKKNPFNQKSQAETISAILAEEPVPLHEFASKLPASLINLVEKCLEKDTAKRFQSAAEILVELEKTDSENYRQVVSRHRRNFFIKAAFAALVLLLVFTVGWYFYGGKRPQRTLAVLPITFESPPPDKEYLADGLTQSIIDKLSNLSDLKVKSRFTVANFKGKTVEPQITGKQLNVDAVYIGSIAKRDDSLFLTAKLYRVSDGFVLDEYEPEKIEETRLIDLQEKVSARIIDTVKANLTDEDITTLNKRDTQNEEAKRLYFLGRYHLERKANGDLDKAIGFFTRAKELDPAFVKNWTGLADASLSLGLPGVENPIMPKEATGNAKAALRHISMLDKNLPEVYNSVGMINSKYDWDWAEAENNYRTAIRLNPEFIPARVGLISVLNIQGRFNESLKEAQEIKEIDPFSILPYFELAKIYLKTRDTAQMEKLFSEMLEKFPDNKLRISYLQTYQFLQIGRFQEAIETLEKLYESGTESQKVFVCAPLGFAYAKTGQQEKALQLVNYLETIAKKHYVPSQEKAVIYIGLGDFDKAFENLNKSCAERFSAFPALLDESLLDEIKTDARFSELKKCANL